MNNEENVCSVCHEPIKSEYFFCPNCGHNLREKPVQVTLIAQIGIYALAILLPPLGLWPGIKYLSKTGKQAKKVGIIAIVLTLLSSVLTIWLTFQLFNSYISQMNDLINSI